MAETVRCGRCGCADLRRADGTRGTTPGAERFERKVCRNCGKMVRVKRAKKKDEAEVKAVFYRPVTCPQCASERCPVTSTISAVIRRHKCSQCGHTFKSVKKLI